MARKKSSSFDKARQALLRGIRDLTKSARRKNKAKAAAVKKARDRETVLRWKALNKYGLISSKETPTLSHLTPYLRRRINKVFHQTNQHGHFARGMVNRPLVRETYQTPSGKTKTRYTTSGYFKFARTKHKTVLKSGVIKTKKGYIIEVASPDVKIKVEKNGDIIRKSKFGYERRFARRGSAILTLYDDIKSGKIKLRNNQVLIYHPFGSHNAERAYYGDSIDSFLEDVEKYEIEMIPSTFKAWSDHSEVTVLSGRSARATRNHLENPRGEGR